MKLVVFGPFKRLGGLLKDNKIVDLNLAYRGYLKDKGQTRAEAQADLKLPAKLQDFLDEGDSALEAARTALAYAQRKKGEPVISLEGVRIWTPLPSTGSRIVCAASNFAVHVAGSLAAEAHREITRRDLDQFVKKTEEGQHPLSGFWKQARCVIGPDEPVIYPKRAEYLDYEVELVAIIGKQCKDIPDNEKAMDYVFGYSGFNDWSIRGYGKGERSRAAGNWVVNKNFDTCASLGPCIVTRDEITDPYNVGLRLSINGEIRQDGNTNQMIRRFPAWIAHISRDFTLYPGDMFASGTPAGTASDTTLIPKDGLPSTDRFLKVGDVVEMSFEGIGSMKHKVIAGK